MSLSRLISFPDDFNPSQPALAENAPPPEPAGLEGADEPATRSSTSSALSAEMVLSHLDPEEGAGYVADTQSLLVQIMLTLLVRLASAAGIDLDALLAAMAATPAPPPPSSRNRSLAQQTSISFRMAAATANKGKSKEPVQAATTHLPPPPRPSSPATATAYFYLGLNPAPPGTEAAGAAQSRHSDNEVALVNAVHRLDEDCQSQHRIAREWDEEMKLMLTEARIRVAEDTRKLKEIQHGDHVVLGSLINTVNGLRRDISGLRSSLVADAALAPLPILVDSSPFLQPSSTMWQPAPACMGPPSSEAGPSTAVRRDHSAFEDDLPPAKCPRTSTSAPQEEPYNVLFYDVTPAGEARDLARAAMQAIPHLNVGSFINTIWPRNKMTTISICFRTHPFVLTFIDVIENCPPSGFEGLHACWAPVAADPVSIIRGEGFNRRSTG
ncbi:hypothetical protein DFH07DRAFT_973514 [Mycena maculata]|uniref:Uncharacterized protein n=1 Tax=Mycena maculata TaxID=230809 RepID=A0AAD7HCH6_9AGAR|nr:hypothetical protein DFH07DRAFT_973514 [Mycena maculata]